MPGGVHYRDELNIQAPGRLCIGGLEEFANIFEIIHGQVNLDLPACAAGNIVSASAAVAGINSALPGTWRAFAYPANWGSAAMFLAAVTTAHGVLTVTGCCPSASGTDAFSCTANYMAIRTET